MPLSESITQRDLSDQVSPRVRSFLDDGERPLVIVRGVPGSIVATTRRVIVERWESPTQPVVFQYAELSGAVAHLRYIGRRFVALVGPGLNANPGTLEIGRSTNATVVQIWRFKEARQAVAELNSLITAMNAQA